MAHPARSLAPLVPLFSACAAPALDDAAAVPVAQLPKWKPRRSSVGQSSPPPGMGDQ
jgi:hypothetical protein